MVAVYLIELHVEYDYRMNLSNKKVISFDEFFTRFRQTEVVLTSLTTHIH